MRTVMCIDLKSFFASCECVERGMDPFTTPLVVTDLSRGKGGIVLAVSPFLKSRGVKSRCRVKELPTDIDIIFAKPRMSLYLEKSKQIVNIYLDYISYEDMFVYSIDEVFLDLTDYIKFYNTDAYKLAYALKKQVFKQTGIPSSVGIGDNMLMAKLAMDIESKKVKNSIAIWSKEDVSKKLWAVKELTEVWGIGAGNKRRLENIGIYTIKQLAQTDKDILIKHFGKQGEKLYNTANGIDNTIISKDISYKMPKSIGNSQMLHKDTNSIHAKLLLREMLENIVIKLKRNNYVARTINVYIRYSFNENLASFSKRMTLDFASDDLHVFVNEVNQLIDRELERGMIRQLGVALSQIEYKEYIQLQLFNEYAKNEKIDNALLDIKERFGKSSVLYGSSLYKESTAMYRNTLIGGHNGGEEDE